MTSSLQTVSCKEAAAKSRSPDVSKKKTVSVESTKEFINKYINEIICLYTTLRYGDLKNYKFLLCKATIIRFSNSQLHSEETIQL
jgi:hypothetical protein